MSSITVGVVFTKNAGQPATGLALADIEITLLRRTKADGTVATVWSALNPTEEVGGGIYTKRYTSADESTYEYYGWAQYTGAVGLDNDYALHLSPGFSAAAVWGHDERTLTQSAASIAAIVLGDDITILRGDSLIMSVAGLGDISNRTKMWFTLKRHKEDDDADALIQIEETEGLLYLNGAAAGTPANGAINVTDEVVGNATITLGKAEAAELASGSGLSYDVQTLTNTGIVTTNPSGNATVAADITRAVV